MKNRRMLIAVFMCFAVLFVGVGYAQLVGHLGIDGTAIFDHSAAEEGFMNNLTFSIPENGAIESNGSAVAEGLADEIGVSTDGNTATFAVKTLATMDETVTFTYNLTNNNTVPVDVTISATHDDGTPNPQYKFSVFSVDSITVDDVSVFENNNHVSGDAPVVNIASQETVQVKVTVRLTTTPSSDVAEEVFKLHLIAQTELAADETTGS